MFTKGNQYGRHNNHHGQLTKEQTAALRAIVNNSIQCWKEILTNGKTDIRWMQLKADIASRVINKFVPELVQESKELVISDRFIDFATDLATRISSVSQGHGRRP